MQIISKEHPKHKIVVMEGEFSMYNSKELRTVIHDAIDNGIRSLIIDVGLVTDLDSSIIDVWVFGNKKMNKENGKFYLMNLTERISDVLDLIGIKIDSIKADEL